MVNGHAPGVARLRAERTEPMDRTYVVTGAASGIGAATARYCRGRGGRVIACDLHGADVVADLTTVEARAALVDGVTRLSEGRIDAIVANAGGGPPETSLSLNFFGAVATRAARQSRNRLPLSDLGGDWQAPNLPARPRQDQKALARPDRIV